MSYFGIVYNKNDLRFYHRHTTYSNFFKMFALLIIATHAPR